MHDVDDDDDDDGGGGDTGRAEREREKDVGVIDGSLRWSSVEWLGFFFPFFLLIAWGRDVLEGEVSLSRERDGKW